MLTSAVLIVMLQATATPPQPADTAPAMRVFAEANVLYEKRENDKALAAYEQAIALDGNNADFHLGRCRTLARLQRHEDAIASCTNAIEIRPDNAAALLDRGHFYINLRKIDQALADLTRADALKADEYGLVYHLGLAHYLAGDYQRAAAVYERCVPSAKTPDNVVACSAWQYVALARAGRADDARKVLDAITPDLKVQESAAYLDRLLLFKGSRTEEQVAAAMDKDALSLPTIAYSIGVWHLLNGREAKAREYFQKAVSPPAQKSAFGSVASDAELARLKS